MLSSAASKSIEGTETQQLVESAQLAASNKIWLRRLLHDFLPLFYTGFGIAALLATLFVSEWFWFLPHSLLFSAACLHFGIYIYRRRHCGPDTDRG